MVNLKSVRRTSRLLEVFVIIWGLNLEESGKIESRESGDKSGWSPGGRIKETDRDVDVDRNLKEGWLHSSCSWEQSGDEKERDQSEHICHILFITAFLSRLSPFKRIMLI